MSSTNPTTDRSEPRIRIAVPSLLVSLELEEDPRIWIVAETAEDEARLLSWLLRSPTALADLEGSVLEILAGLDRAA